MAAGRNTAQRLVVAERRAQAVQLRLAGHTWDTIATQLGYSGAAAACKDVSRALRAALDKLKQATDELREQELQHLYALRQKAWEVMQREHPYVSGGTVVRDYPVDTNGDRIMSDPVTGDPLPIPPSLRDDGPTLAAIDRLVRIEQQIAKLTGIEAPQVVEGTGVVRYIVEGIDMSKLT